MGIVDPDYYNNIDNEGHIWIKLQNESNETFEFKKGEALVQGIFMKYLSTKEDRINNIERRTNHSKK